MKKENFLCNLYLKKSIIVDISDDFLDLVKYAKEDIVNKELSEVLKLLRVNIDFNDVMEENKDYYVFTKDYKPIEVRIIKTEDILAFVVKEINAVEKNFIMIDELYKENNLGIAIFSVPDIALLKANRTFLNFWDEPFNTKEATYGKRVDEFITGWKESSAKEAWDALLSEGKIIRRDNFEYDYLKRGKTAWKSTMIPIYENKKVKYVVDISEEITEQYFRDKQIKEEAFMVLKENNELERTIENQEKFFSFISHEFKTPLTVTLSAIQAMELLYKEDMNVGIKKYLGKIYQSTLQQMRLVNNLLDITSGSAGFLKINKSNMDIVNVTNSIVNSIILFANEKNINIKFSSSVRELKLAIDDEKFERIILNLLSNAIKFTPNDSNIYVNISRDHSNVYVEVKDQGVGIPKEKQKIIFERFGQVGNSLTRQSEGTGIGLYIVKLLVQASGGDIELQSEVGEGSSFKLRFPIELVKEEESKGFNLLDDRLTRSINVEFSSIYFD